MVCILLPNRKKKVINSSVYIIFFLVFLLLLIKYLRRYSKKLNLTAFISFFFSEFSNSYTCTYYLMCVFIDECNWQQQQYQVILLKTAMKNIKAANHVLIQSCKQISNFSNIKYYYNIIDLSIIKH